MQINQEMEHCIKHDNNVIMRCAVMKIEQRPAGISVSANTETSAQ